MEYRPSLTEQRIKYALIILAVVIIAAVTALYLAPGFRLALGQRLGIVPGADAIRIADAGQARLIVISEPVHTRISQPRYRQVARYIVHSGAETTVTDLASGASFPLPTPDFNRVLISSDRTRLLFEGDAASTVVVVSESRAFVAQEVVAADWSEDVYVRGDWCSGSSLHDTYALCLRGMGRGRSRYIFGNWEVQVRPFGTSTDWDRLYRGRGLVPIVGFAPDERSVYIYNDLGIWQVPIE